MRIAQVAPLYESVPPRLYGGTERVVHYITEQLVELGHDVTLFASGDSVTSAKLSAQTERALRLDPRPSDGVAEHVAVVEQVVRRRNEFDVIHFHIDYVHFPVSRRERLAHLTTLHGRLDIGSLGRLYREFAEMPVVSISDAQRAGVPHANWLGTVHHGLPLDLLRYTERADGYLAFVGRVSPEKGLREAIQIAVKAGTEIRVAAKVDPADRNHFETNVLPLLSHPLVDFVGEIDDARKSDFIGKAKALLFPIDWPEPFGLVMIESMACGTPVIAFRRGSVPEIIENGLTGLIVEDIEGAVAAVRDIDRIDRGRIRRRFEQRFSSRRMVREYLSLYGRIAGGARTPALRRSQSAA